MHHDAHLKKLGVTDTIASLPAICRSLNFGKRFRELHGRALPVMQVGTAWRSLLRIPKDAIRINTTFGDHHHTGRIIHTQATFEENSWMLSHNYSDEDIAHMDSVFLDFIKTNSKIDVPKELTSITVFQSLITERPDYEERGRKRKEAEGLQIR
jgi:hypothetical protein